MARIQDTFTLAIVPPTGPTTPPPPGRRPEIIIAENPAYNDTLYKIDMNLVRAGAPPRVQINFKYRLGSPPMTNPFQVEWSQGAIVVSGSQVPSVEIEPTSPKLTEDLDNDPTTRETAVDPLKYQDGFMTVTVSSQAAAGRTEELVFDGQLYVEYQ